MLVAISRVVLLLVLVMSTYLIILNAKFVQMLCHIVLIVTVIAVVMNV